ncbi:MAG TPA: hypothetical protein VGN18_15095 [Jatrophihabitans sp.]|jgi:hypothetical protein|nr:hypothetical protein [Jatrophihabitans sp.]
MNNISRKLRQRRNRLEFERVLRNASPAMQQELIAAAAHQHFNMR